MLSILLLFLPPLSATFCVIYLLCGYSDMIDGTVARMTHSVSEFGAKLDTIADLVFLAVCLFQLLPIVQTPTWLWLWIAAIAIIKIGNLLWGFLRDKQLVSLHTLMNKITGFLLFLLPLTLPFVEPIYSLTAVCTVATFVAIQEGYYIGRIRYAGKDA